MEAFSVGSLLLVVCRMYNAIISINTPVPDGAEQSIIGVLVRVSLVCRNMAAVNRENKWSGEGFLNENTSQ